jgi:L-arabinonolactonase
MARIVIDCANSLGECVLWCERSQRVLWTDILGATLYAHHPASGMTFTWAMPERLASFALTGAEDRLLLGLASRLAFFDLATGTVTPLADVEPDLSTRLNDGRCDRAGNFVFGTFNEAEPRLAIGSFYRLSAAGLHLERLDLPSVAIANSICFSPDGTTMYYCDSPTRTIRHCDYPALTKDRVFAHVEGEGEPDGSSVDADGYLWNAQWGAAQVVRYAPDGRIDRSIGTKALQPSCVAFGGAGADTLYCSSARIGLAAPGRADGALLALATGGIRGLPESRFAG